MENGEITEQGSHAELIAAGGLYARLWQRQSGGFLGGELAGDRGGELAGKDAA